MQGEFNTKTVQTYYHNATNHTAADSKPFNSLRCQTEYQSVRKEVEQLAPLISAIKKCHYRQLLKFNFPVHFPKKNDTE